jgi:hypothetical protein
MLNRFFTKNKVMDTFYKRVHNRKYLTMTRPFPGGCIIKVMGNTKDSHLNKKDLLHAIPETLRSRECISLIVGPAILIPKEPGVYGLYTPLTHLAAFISKASISDIAINEKTIVSKLQYGHPKIKNDTENIGYGRIKEQDYVTKSKYQSGNLFSKKLFSMPQQEYQYRYFIFLAVDSIKNDQNLYIRELEKKIEDFIREDIYYDRQNNSCVHPILVLFGQLSKELYKSGVPQIVAVDVIKTLLNDYRLTYAKFLSVASSTGLADTPYKSSINFEEIFESDNKNPALSTIKNTFGYTT